MHSPLKSVSSYHIVMESRRVVVKEDLASSAGRNDLGMLPDEIDPRLRRADTLLRACVSEVDAKRIRPNIQCGDRITLQLIRCKRDFTCNLHHISQLGLERQNTVIRLDASRATMMAPSNTVGPRFSGSRSLSRGAMRNEGEARLCCDNVGPIRSNPPRKCKRVRQDTDRCYQYERMAPFVCTETK